MKSFCMFIILFAALSVQLLEAGTPKTYGKPVTLKSKTSVSDILAAPDKFNGKKVLIVVAVVDECESRG